MSDQKLSPSPAPTDPQIAEIAAGAVLGAKSQGQVEYEIAELLQQQLDALRAAREGQSFDLRAHLKRQREWSERTFGPGQRTVGVLDHIRKELREIEAEPGDLREWIDVVILALDGAWRAGFDADEIIDTLVTKQARNEARQWPDWRTADPNAAIEHVRAAAPEKGGQ